MNDLSNRTLLILVVIALSFSVLGTVTVLSRLGYNLPLITGLASSSTEMGNVSVTVAGTTSIDLVTNISFGNGSNSGGVILSTNDSQGTPNTFADPGDFRIENDGNVDVNLTINGSRAADFITTGTSPLWNWTATNATGDNGCNSNLSTVNRAFGSGAFNRSVCMNLSFVDATDSVNVSVFLFIPSDTLPNTYTTNVFFAAVRVP